MKRSIAAVMAILVLLVSLLCACKKDDTKTNADTTGEAQTSTDRLLKTQQPCPRTAPRRGTRRTRLSQPTPQSPARPLRIR